MPKYIKVTRVQIYKNHSHKKHKQSFVDLFKDVNVTVN